MSDLADAYGVLGLGAEAVAIAGPSPTLVPLDRIRSGILFTVDVNGADSVYFKTVRRGAAAPTVSQETFHLRISPGSDRMVNWGGPLDIYAYATSPTKFTALPVRF